MSVIYHFIPMLVFVGLLSASGVYHMWLGIDNAFYKLPAAVAILPALIVAYFLHRGSMNDRINDFLAGVGHKDIITMCVIFVLVGAFASVADGLGCNDAVVQFFLHFVSPRYVILGLFWITAIVATSIGTSMGAVAAIVPIAVAMCEHVCVSKAFGVGAIIGGAMLGDNLSLISDTTIAAVSSQGADVRDKFWLNFRLCMVAGLITSVFLVVSADQSKSLPLSDYNIMLILPYLVLLILALSGLHAFVAIISATVVAGLLGFFVTGYTFDVFVKSIGSGYVNMHEIMILSLLVGGMSGLMGKSAIEKLSVSLTQWMARKKSGRREAELMIGGLSALFDVLVANNTIAILMVGPIAKQISQRHRIAPYVSAAWLDMASCVFQGILPYGAQILLASALAQLSPFEILPNVYFCYISLVVMVCYILFGSSRVAGS